MYTNMSKGQFSKGNFSCPIREARHLFWDQVWCWMLDSSISQPYQYINCKKERDHAFFLKLVQLLQAAEEFCKAKITAGMKELVLISRIRGTLPGEMKAHFHVLPCCWGFCPVLSNADVWNGKCTCLQNVMFRDSGYFSCAWVLSMDWMCILCFNFLKPWAEESLLGILTNLIAVCVPLFPSPTPRSYNSPWLFVFQFSLLCSRWIAKGVLCWLRSNKRQWGKSGWCWPTTPLITKESVN